MTKLQINFLKDNQVRTKDEILQDFLRAAFDQQDNSYEGLTKCDEIILTCRTFKYFSLAVELQKELNSVETYKVILMERNGEIDGLYEMSTVEIPILL